MRFQSRSHGPKKSLDVLAIALRVFPPRTTRDFPQLISPVSKNRDVIPRLASLRGMLYAAFSGRFFAILDFRKSWFMNHSVRCPVCAGTVVIDPIPAEALSSPSEGQPGNSVEDLVLCSNCGNAIEVKRVEGSSIAAGTLEHGHDLESLPMENAERADVDIEKGDSDSHEGDLVDQATAWMPDDESEMTLELEEEVSDSELDSDIDLDVSEQEHTFDTSDIDEEEAEPIRDAIGLTATHFDPEISTESVEAFQVGSESNASSPTPIPVSVPIDLTSQMDPEMDALALGGETSRMDAELQDMEAQDSMAVQPATPSESVPSDPADRAYPDGWNDNEETVAVEGEANPPWIESTSETSNDVAVLPPTGSPDWTSVAIRPRSRAQDKSPLWKLLPPVLGGLTALPISIGILWYVFGKDIGNAGPTVARYVPWIVPKHLRGRPQWKSTPDSELRSKKPTLPSGRSAPNLDAGDFGTIGRSRTRPSIDNTPKASLPIAPSTTPNVDPATEDEAGILDADRTRDESPKESTLTPRKPKEDPSTSDVESALQNVEDGRSTLPDGDRY